MTLVLTVAIFKLALSSESKYLGTLDALFDILCSICFGGKRKLAETFLCQDDKYVTKKLWYNCSSWNIEMAKIKKIYLAMMEDQKEFPEGSMIGWPSMHRRFQQLRHLVALMGTYNNVKKHIKKIQGVYRTFTSIPIKRGISVHLLKDPFAVRKGGGQGSKKKASGRGPGLEKKKPKGPKKPSQKDGAKKTSEPPKAGKSGGEQVAAPTKVGGDSSSTIGPKPSNGGGSGIHGRRFLPLARPKNNLQNASTNTTESIILGDGVGGYNLKE